MAVGEGAVEDMGVGLAEVRRAAVFLPAATRSRLFSTQRYQGLREKMVLAGRNTAALLRFR